MSNTNWWFFDLTLVIVIAGGLSFGIISGISGIGRILLAIPLICFLPGYALVSALFPDEPNEAYQLFDEGKTGLGNPLLASGGLESIERIVLSIVFSVAIVPTITLFASVSPRGVTLEPVLFGIAGVTILCALVSIVARYRCTPTRRYTPSVRSMVPVFTAQATLYDRPSTRAYNIAIVVGLVLVAGTVGFAVANPPQHDGFTEFAIESEGVDGDQETMYEATFEDEDSHELETTITNHEHEERTYTTVVLLEDVSYGDGNESSVTVHEQDEVDRQTETVADGETVHQTLDVTPTMTDSELRLTLLLYDDEPPSEPTAENAYRAIQLPMEGT
ncbi:DUF1616 domain-containing protein [Natronolimnobius sp. AArcel1]|uniref:DUF1616 domain-containing protein n=1 Tax=Natronolimnobius sp. AArcel1 TaxID=1679093 RepID=UPI0013ECAF40|nr:DUF1616 domain-containing protein [Natronolimnobius sp. AArcel1]NGM70448.1 DUF1616 domain-containing protein [Natronolimnobius sp. AArcel1]